MPTTCAVPRGLVKFVLPDPMGNCLSDPASVQKTGRKPVGSLQVASLGEEHNGSVLAESAVPQLVSDLDTDCCDEHKQPPPLVEVGHTYSPDKSQDSVDHSINDLDEASNQADPGLEPPHRGAMQQLIDGLPNEVVLSCLARLPVRDHIVLSSINSAWRACFGDMLRKRKELGTTETFLFLTRLAEPRGQRAYLSLHVYVGGQTRWFTATLPGETAFYCYGHKLLAIGTTLYLLTGSVEILGDPTNEVWEYNVRGNRWTKRQGMQVPRSGYALGVLQGRIVVAGGQSKNYGSQQSTCEMYDPSSGCWEMVCPMSESRSRLESVVVQGQLFIFEGGELVEMYDSATNRWSVGNEPAWAGELAKSRITSTVATDDGSLFRLARAEEALTVYRLQDPGIWVTVAGSRMTEASVNEPPIQPRLACTGSRVVLVGSNFCVYSINVDDGLESCSSHRSFAMPSLPKAQRTEVCGFEM